MEEGQGLSSHGASHDASSRDLQAEISTGFSATAASDDREPLLSSSAFPTDAQLDLDDYGELDALGSSSSPPPPNRLWSAPLPRLKRSPFLLHSADTDTTTSAMVPLESLYNPFFPFPTTTTTANCWGPGVVVPKAAPPAGSSERKFEDRDVSGSTSPRVMASKLLEVQAACHPTWSSKPGTSGAHNAAAATIRPPAEKRRRSQDSSFRAQYFAPDVIGGRVGGGPSTSVAGSRELHAMEQLLIQCASALEARDFAQAQQAVFAIDNVASEDGDPNQRLLACFLRALLLRAGSTFTFAPQLWSCGGDDAAGRGVRSGLGRPSVIAGVKTALELTNYIDVMPWYRFGFIAANGALVQAFEGKGKVHILDLNVSHCMQWPTLIETLAERSEGPPQVRLTVCVSKSPIPPLLEVPYEELLLRLAKFARSKNVPFEYDILVEDVEDLDMSKIRLREDEALAVNCLLRLHHVSEECHGEQPQQVSCRRLSPRDQVLRFLRALNPVLVTLMEEDANLTLPQLVPRLRAAFNYLWIPFDALHTLLPEDSAHRHLCEDEVARKIENVVACEGRQRTERAETKDRWVQRMRRARFEMVAFSEDVVAENKLMLGEHSGCWGLRKADEEEVLFLNWKGHTVSFASAWVPVDHQMPLRHHQFHQSD